MADAERVGQRCDFCGSSALVPYEEIKEAFRPESLLPMKISETQVREIMSGDLTIVTPREPIENCLRMMTDKRIRHLPVVEGDTLRGIISIGDLVKWVIASQSAAIAHLEHYISGGYSG